MRVIILIGGEREDEELFFKRGVGDTESKRMVQSTHCWRSLPIQTPDYKGEGYHNPSSQRCCNTYPKGYREEDGAKVLAPPFFPFNIILRNESQKKEGVSIEKKLYVPGHFELHR